jgi:secreted trypsin-like serine protease
VGDPSKLRRMLRAAFVATLAVAAVGLSAGAAPATPAPSSPPPDLSQLVVGGHPVALNDFPALAAILLAQPREIAARDRLLCSGTVVARRWVLSAGHCSDPVLFGEPLLVQVGRPDLGDGKAVIAHVNRAVVHRVFMKRGLGFDVALFHTATDLDVPKTRLATAADLPLMAEGRDATIVGWGLTKRLGIEEFPSANAHPPVRARAVTVPLVGDETCVDVYRDFFPHFVVPGSDLCAGTEGRDACYGDSGGPLYANDPQGQLVQIGITSRGAGCATKAFPGVFTDVRRMHGWIHHWTTQPCPNRFQFPSDPSFPEDFPTGPLYVC